MSQARHPKPPEVAALSIEDIAQRYVARFRDRKPDWNAFEDARIEGYKRAQHRFKCVSVILLKILHHVREIVTSLRKMLLGACFWHAARAVSG